jgi:hypothetical protein
MLDGTWYAPSQTYTLRLAFDGENHRYKRLAIGRKCCRRSYAVEPV